MTNVNVIKISYLLFYYFILLAWDHRRSHLDGDYVIIHISPVTYRCSTHLFVVIGNHDTTLVAATKSTQTPTKGGKLHPAPQCISTLTFWSTATIATMFFFCLSTPPRSVVSRLPSACKKKRPYQAPGMQPLWHYDNVPVEKRPSPFKPLATRNLCVTIR